MRRGQACTKEPQHECRGGVAIPVTQRHQKPGTWNLKLKENCPRSVYSVPDFFDHIVVTATKLEPIAGFSNANILANAIYTGVIHTKPDHLSLEGAGLDYWLGTPDGGAELIDSTAYAVGGSTALSTAVGVVIGSLTSITSGTLNDSGLSSISGWQLPGAITPRERLDALMILYGAEYRVNPTGTIDTGLAANLFVTTPTVVITRHEEGQEGSYRGLAGTDLTAASDVQQYTTTAVAYDSLGVAYPVTGAATTYRNFAGQLVTMYRNFDAAGYTGVLAEYVSGPASANFRVRTNLKLSSDTYAVGRFLDPGDYFYAWDQEAGLIDQANQIPYRGETITPIKLRVYAMTWPFADGMGVYLRHATGAGTYTYTDLSDQIEWETSDVEWEVGAAARELTDSTTYGSAAVLGSNPRIIPRVTARAAGFASGSPAGTGTDGDEYWDTTNERLFRSDGSGWIVMAEPVNIVTPTLTGMAVGTGGSATNLLNYHRSDGFLDFEWHLTFGTAGTTFPTNPTVALPIAMADVEASFTGIYLDTAVARYHGLAATNSTTTLALVTFTAAAVGITTTTPFTWGAGDQMIFRGRYRMTTRYS